MELIPAPKKLIGIVHPSDHGMKQEIKITEFSKSKASSFFVPPLSTYGFSIRLAHIRVAMVCVQKTDDRPAVRRSRAGNLPYFAQSSLNLL